MKRSRALSWILTVCMALTMLPLGAIQASALEVIVEIDDNPDPTVIVEIPDDPDPIVIVDLPDDPTPDEPPIVIVGINITGSGTEEDPFTIYTGKGMRTFVSMIEQGGTFSGYHACLGQDIDLSEICGSETGDWVPIGNQDSPFAGTFDGKGHTISGLYIGTRVDRGGLFGAVTGTVRNLTVDGQIAIGNNTGGIAGENRGLIENCTFAGTLIGGSSAIAGVGGIAGLNSGTIRGCCNTGTFEAVSISQVGGIAGTLKGGSVTDCVNKGGIHNAISTASSGTGGIVGSYEGGDLSSCRNEGAVAGGASTGGIAGEVLNKRETTGCVNTGAVSGRGGNVGGIVGRAGWQCNVSDCRNAGPVNGSGGTGGIVGYLETAEVYNCTNTGNVGSGGANTGMKGGIVGYADAWSEISYCGNFGNITAGIEEDYYGGIVGFGESSHIFYCYNTGNVTCWNFGGGISGYTNDSMWNCFNTGNVSSTNGTASGKSFGGISGYFYVGSLKNSYNTGEIKGYENVGGIAGNFTQESIENCVSTGKVSGAIDVGALVGYRGKWDEVDWDRSKFRHNYYCNEYDSDISAVGGWSDGQLGEDSVKKITRREYLFNSDNNAYIDWDFDNTWYMTDSGPRLRNLVFGVNNNTVTISSVADLILFRDNCNAGLGYKDVTVKLAANLDLSGQANWIPIAYTKIDPDASFSGTFDGCGHTISGLTIDLDENYAGLFGNVDGTIKNLTVKGSVKGKGGVGGIAGVLRYGTVENCNFQGSVTGEFSVGGIVGENYMGTIRRCIARGSVTGTTDSGDNNYCAAGGIAGYLLSECTIEECVANIDVTGLTGTGGIAGRCEYSLIKNSLHTGSVNGLVDVGGIAGICKFLSGAVTDRGIWFCYHHGGMIKSQATILTGGIAGKAEKLTGIMGGYGIYLCYYLGGTVQNGLDAQNGTTTDVGIGLPYGQTQDANPTNMAQPLTAEQFKNAGSFANWDFDSVWQMSAERPVLRNTALKDISSAVVTFGSQETYDGTEKNVVIESVTLNGAALDDYVITDGSTATDVAETTLTISGTGFYTGTATAGWSLQKADPARKDFTIPAPVTADYTGSPVDMASPVAKVDGMGEVTVHYSPEGHTDAGTYILSFDVAEGSNYKAASNIVYSYLTINKIDDPAVVVSSATLEAGGNTVDLSGNVTGAEGEVTYAIDGDANGCTVDEATGVFTSGAFGGTVAVTVTIGDSTNHNGREETIEVTVTGAAPKTLTGLAVTSGPAITSYLHGDVLDTSGMVVTAEYNHQYEEEISGYTVSYADGAYLKKGDRTATVSFEDMTAEIGGLTVGPKELTVTGLTAVSRAADGTTTVVLTGGTLQGVLDGESVTAVIPATGEVDTPEAGSAKPVSFEAITLNGPDAGYYTVIQPDVTVDITEGQSDDPTEPDPPVDTKVVATPVLSEPSQTFRGKLEVTITCETSGAAIHYTMDGSVPTASSAVYTEGEIITIGKTATLQAIAVLAGFENSEIAKAVYTKKTAQSVTPPKDETLEDPETPKDSGTPEEFPFEDVPETAYFRKAVEWAHRTGVTGGTTPATFSPDAEATRAQTIMFLWAASGCPEPEAAVNPFTDLSEDDYFYKAVLWAYENGITAGIGGGLFGSDETISRAQVVMFLYSLAGRPEAGSEPFEDVDPGDYFQKAVAWAYGENITSGTGAETFSPDADCLREQIITFLYRYFGGE